MNKLAVLAATVVLAAGGAAAAHSLAGTPSSTPSNVRPVLGDSQSPRFVRNHDGVITVNAPHRKHDRAEMDDHPVLGGSSDQDGRTDHTEPGDDHGD